MKIKERNYNESDESKSQKNQKKEKLNIFDTKAKELTSQIIEMAKQTYIKELQKISKDHASEFEKEAKTFIEKSIKDIVKKHYYSLFFPLVSHVKIEKLDKGDKFTYEVSFSLKFLPLPSITKSPIDQKFERDLLNEPEMHLSFKAIKK